MALLVGCFKENPELSKAYSDPAVVLGIFRHISHVAQHFLMTLLFMEEQIGEIHLVRFADSVQEAKAVLIELKGLRLFIEGNIIEGNMYVKVNPDIQIQLKRMLSEPVSCTLRIRNKPDKRIPGAGNIMQHFRSSWEKIIEFLI